MKARDVREGLGIYGGGQNLLVTNPKKQKQEGFFGLIAQVEYLRHNGCLIR